jgi:hypothetical protein
MQIIRYRSNLILHVRLDSLNRVDSVRRGLTNKQRREDEIGCEENDWSNAKRKSQTYEGDQKAEEGRK